jgi:hypothetical protein
MGGKRGERSTGGKAPTERAAAEREEEDFADLLAAQKAPAQPSSTLLKRPPQLPPMVNIKDGDGG